MNGTEWVSTDNYCYDDPTAPAFKQDAAPAAGESAAAGQAAAAIAVGEAVVVAETVVGHEDMPRPLLASRRLPAKQLPQPPWATQRW